MFHRIAWASHTPDPSARAFKYERRAFREGVEFHRETVTVWMMSHRDFLTLLQAWNAAGERPNVNGLAYRYVEA